MKQICTLIAFACTSLISLKSYSQVTQNFESQAEVNSLLSSCWTFNNVNFTNTSQISGTGSVVGQLNATSEIITPELQIPSTLNISFSYNTIASINGSKTLKVLLVINGVETLLESINLQQDPTGNFSGTYTSANTPGNNINGSRRIIFRTNNNVSVVIDNLTINAPYTYINGCATGNSPLPVKFANFSAKKFYDAVSITWNVGTEQNVAGYEVQKSIDGKNFSKIGFVSANSNNTYSFVDNSPSATAYYRVKSLDVDGKYSYSTVALIKSGQSSIVIKAFPVPAIQNITIQHGTAGAGSLLTVSAEDGRVIKSVVPAVNAQQTEVDLSSAKAGLYLVRYTNSNGEAQIIKIVKQ